MLGTGASAAQQIEPGEVAAGVVLRRKVAEISARRAVPTTRRSGLFATLLQIPLKWKLIGASAVFILIAVGAAVTFHESPIAIPVLLITMLAILGVNLVLVVLALRPLGLIERTATRVWQGDLDARVQPSLTADRDMRRVGNTFNLLLDGLTADRARMRLLAGQVINAQDAERARLARELHDSTAQTLAAAMLQLSAITTQVDPTSPLGERLADLRSLVSASLEEVRTLAHTIHPRVLDDLGLLAALEWLARTTSCDDVLDVVVEGGAGASRIPPAAAATLYRVAQESVRNAVRHASARTIRILLTIEAEGATLSVIDDGRGFDVVNAESRRPGMGLFSIRERVALLNGTVDIHSVVGSGTRVTATVPLEN